MKESAQQYTARIAGYVEGQDPIKVLESTPRKLAALVKGLSPAAANYKPSPEKWNIREQVAHLADSQFVLDGRFRWAAAEPGKHVAAFDQDKWAATAKYAKIPLEVSLAAFTAARRWTLELLKRLNHDERQGFIQHEERGREDFAKLLVLEAGHDLNHLRQIEELAKAGRSRAKRVPKS